jgi:hypothetical protein
MYKYVFPSAEIFFSVREEQKAGGSNIWEGKMAVSIGKKKYDC